MSKNEGTPFKGVTIKAVGDIVTSDHPFFDGMTKPWFLPDGGEITITGELFADGDSYRIDSLHSSKGTMLFGSTDGKSFRGDRR